MKKQRNIRMLYFIWRRVWHQFKGDAHGPGPECSPWILFQTRGKNPKRIAKRLKTRIEKKQLGKFYNKEFEKHMESKGLGSCEIKQISNTQFNRMKQKRKAERKSDGKEKNTP